jgi:hypothetical protein
MGDGWQHDGFRGRVARQPIGHDGARYHLEALQELGCMRAYGSFARVMMAKGFCFIRDRWQ